MMKNKSYFLFPFVLCCLLLCFAACQKSEPPTQLPEVLPAPQNLRIDDEILKWDAVEGASGYVVTEGREQYEATDNQLDIFSLAIERDWVYSFTVIAKGDDQSFWDSERSAVCTYQTTQNKITLAYLLTTDGSGYMVRVADSDKAEGKVIIPESFEGIPVKLIYESGFANSSKITGVYIPDSVEVIEEGAFENCKRLTRVRLPEGLKSIESKVFRDCKSLKQLELPRSLKTVKMGAFTGCERLASLHIPENVEKIDHFPIPELRIDSANWLTGLSVAPENPIYRSEGNCIILRADETLVLGCNASVIPKSVTKIGHSAFLGCQMTEMEISANIVEVDARAFSNCKQLTRIVFGGGVERIDVSALSFTTALQKIEVVQENRIYKSEGNCLIKRSEPHRVILGCKGSVIPEGIAVIGEAAFAQCPIKHMTFPEGVTEIEREAFLASELESVVFPSTLKKIGDRAFYCSHALDAPIIIPAGMEQIGLYAFFMDMDDICPPPVILPSTVQTVFSDAFNGCGVYTDVPNRNSVPSGWDIERGLGRFTVFNCTLEEENGKPYVSSTTLSFENNRCITVGGVIINQMPFREGYNFAGWATEPDGEPVHIPHVVNIGSEEYYVALTSEDIRSYLDQGDTTLYAVWVKNA